MASLLQMDIKDLFSRKNKKTDSNKSKNNNSEILDKTVIKRIIYASVLIIILLVVYFFYVSPTLNEQQNRLKQVETWNTQIKSCIDEIKNLNTSIENLKSESSTKGVLFVSDDEFENFYAELTEATIRNGLKIINITRGEETAIRLNDKDMNNSTYIYTPISSSIPCEQNSQYENMVNNSQSFEPDPNCQGDECNPIAYYKMSVSYEIEGGFSNYVNFRNVLANKPKIVNIENEEIKKNENRSGLIKATATVSLVKNREIN